MDKNLLNEGCSSFNEIRLSRREKSCTYFSFFSFFSSIKIALRRVHLFAGRSTLSRVVVTIVKLQLCEQCFSLACGVSFALASPKVFARSTVSPQFSHSALTLCSNYLHLVASSVGTLFTKLFFQPTAHSAIP